MQISTEFHDHLAAKTVLITGPIRSISVAKQNRGRPQRAWLPVHNSGQHTHSPKQGLQDKARGVDAQSGMSKLHLQNQRCYDSKVQHLNSTSFGYTVAYIVPGAICWVTIGSHSKEILSNNFGGGTIGGLVSTTIIVLFLGLTLSRIRWLIFDSLHQWTGLRSKKWRFDRLVENLPAFESSGSFHYHYYQFYGNSIDAIVLGGPTIHKRSWKFYRCIVAPIAHLQRANTHSLHKSSMT